MLESRNVRGRVLGLTLASLLVAGPAAASDWTVDMAQSSLSFVATQNGSPVEGRFENWTAEISLDPENVADARIRAVIDTATAGTGQPQIDQTLSSASWFDPSSHPQAVFESSQITALGDGRFEAAGELSIKGKAVPLTLPFTLEVENDTARAQAEVPLMRLVFGIGSDIPASTVGDEVAVKIDITAKR